MWGLRRVAAAAAGTGLALAGGWALQPSAATDSMLEQHAPALLRAKARIVLHRRLPPRTVGWTAPLPVVALAAVRADGDPTAAALVEPEPSSVYTLSSAAARAILRDLRTLGTVADRLELALGLATLASSPDLLATWPLAPTEATHLWVHLLEDPPSAAPTNGAAGLLRATLQRQARDAFLRWALTRGTRAAALLDDVTPAGADTLISEEVVSALLRVLSPSGPTEDALMRIAVAARLVTEVVHLGSLPATAAEPMRSTLQTTITRLRSDEFLRDSLETWAAAQSALAVALARLEAPTDSALSQIELITTLRTLRDAAQGLRPSSQAIGKPNQVLTAIALACDALSGVGAGRSATGTSGFSTTTPTSGDLHQPPASSSTMTNNVLSRAASTTISNSTQIQAAPTTMTNNVLSQATSTTTDLTGAISATNNTLKQAAMEAMMSIASHSVWIKPDVAAADASARILSRCLADIPASMTIVALPSIAELASLCAEVFVRNPDDAASPLMGWAHARTTLAKVADGTWPGFTARERQAVARALLYTTARALARSGGLSIPCSRSIGRELLLCPSVTAASALTVVLANNDDNNNNNNNNGLSEDQAAALAALAVEAGEQAARGVSSLRSYAPTLYQRVIDAIPWVSGGGKDNSQAVVSTRLPRPMLIESRAWEGDTALGRHAAEALAYAAADYEAAREQTEERVGKETRRLPSNSPAMLAFGTFEVLRAAMLAYATDSRWQELELETLRQCVRGLANLAAAETLADTSYNGNQHDAALHQFLQAVARNSHDLPLRCQAVRLVQNAGLRVLVDGSGSSSIAPRSPSPAIIDDVFFPVADLTSAAPIAPTKGWHDLLPDNNNNNTVTDIDIVLIHGIDGSALTTWRCAPIPSPALEQLPAGTPLRKALLDASGGVPPHLLTLPADGSSRRAIWPSAWLAPQLLLSHRIAARILSVSFDASPYAGSTTRPDRPIGEVAHIVTRALRRGQVGANGRPVLFVCHSMGGLVAKAAILQEAASAIKASDAPPLTGPIAMAFLATPHRGSLVADFAEELERVPGLVDTSPALRSLKMHHPYLLQLNEAFGALLQSGGPPRVVRVYSAGEGLDWSLPPPARGVRVVPPSSADPGYGTFEMYPQEDHLTINKPGTPTARLMRVIEALALAVANPPP